MKLAILGTRGIPARYGGFETFAEKLAVGLVQRGHEVTVFCEKNGEPAPGCYRGVRLRYAPAPALGPLRTILYDANCLWQARKSFDVVYMLGYGASPFCLIPRLWGKEVWINPDGIEWARAKWNWIAKTYFRLMEWVSVRVAHRIIADAEAVASFLARRHGSHRACSVIRYGCELADALPPAAPLAEWGLTTGSYYLIVCRLEPENHVLEILRAFCRSRSTRALVVVGNHLARTRYVQQLRSLCDSRIRMIGTVYDPVKLTALRCHAFAYMHGHSVGGTNPSLLEAMGCANLVFAHDNPFNRETLGSAGIFFRDADDLAQAIDLAEQDPVNLERRRRAAQSRARTEYLWPDIIDRYVELLERPLPHRKAA
jgi:glycosyltransferase involved in cell wall biosynthesis